MQNSQVLHRFGNGGNRSGSVMRMSDALSQNYSYPTLPKLDRSREEGRPDF
jgi:hypothetical protein